MEVVYIHFSKLYFNDDKKFTLSFKDEEEVKKIFFSKKKKYYITNMTCFIEHDISINKKVRELSEIGRKLLKKPSYELPRAPWVDLTEITVDKNKIKKELTIADDKYVMKSFYYDVNAIYFWDNIKKMD